MRKRFFTPFVGAKYEHGINGKRVLVIGASFYCDKEECCPHFKKCTSTKRKDSSEFVGKCPIYKNYKGEERFIDNEPTLAIQEQYKPYVNFADVMAQYIENVNNKESSYMEVWDHFAFTNYVQFFVPPKRTEKKYLSERDFEAFTETVRGIEPDIVILWGCVINDRLKQNNEFVIDKDFLAKTDWYVCHMKLPDFDKLITLLNPYHPSSSKWHSEKETFAKYLEMVLYE